MPTSAELGENETQVGTLVFGPARYGAQDTTG
jgi:hypothetical protein